MSGHAVAVIDESRCIGCAKCLPACPVDAIVGAANLMHTVIAAECIGCDLCLPPCPVDCIVMVPVAQRLFEPAKVQARRRARRVRDERETRALREARERRKSLLP